MSPRASPSIRFPSRIHRTPGAWQYRLVGPFSVEGMAAGSYSVALAFRFLATQLGGDFTWIPSVEIKKGENIAYECDFAGFWVRDIFLGSEPESVFGECKSFQGRFEERGYQSNGSPREGVR